MKKILLFFLILCQANCQNRTDSEIPSVNDSIHVNPEIQDQELAKTNSYMVFDSTYAFLKVTLNEEKQRIEQELRNVIYGEEALILDDELVFTFKKETYEIFRVGGTEGQSCRITVDFFDMENGNLLKTIKADADEIKFYSSFYITTKWGCCGQENESELKNVNSGKELIDFNEDYYLAKIPNSNINLFWGFKPEERRLIDHKLELNEGLIVGKLNYADLNGKINEVILHAADEDAYQGILWWTPKMRFQSQKMDKIRNNEVELWSNEGAKTIKEVNGFEFQIIFVDDNSGQRDTLVYKIQAGFLNGIQNRVIHDTVKFYSP